MKPGETLECVLERQTRRLHTLNRLAKTIGGNLDLDQIMQAVVDAARDVAEARFGAFFFPGSNDVEASRSPALSGVSRDAIEGLAEFYKTALFAPAFADMTVIRSDDVRTDPRFGLNGSPAMPQTAVASYLAVPVEARSGKVSGTLLLAHDQPGAFDDEIDEVVTAIAMHASIALDNAYLLQASQKESERHRQAQEAAALLAAIVASSEDAILSKTLKGIITSWNKGAERLFGYTSDEAVGKHITMLIPEDRLEEEPAIIDRLRRGERVEHFETIRRRKDGSPIDISLTISPVRNEEGLIIGASKIARDVSDRKRAQEQQGLLLREMNHRVKNLFALATGLVSLSARTAQTPQELATAIRERLIALSRAHDLTLPNLQADDLRPVADTTLIRLLDTILAPFSADGRPAIFIGGTDIMIGAAALTSLALLLHEFATNSAKYGALSVAQGKLNIELARTEDELLIIWSETDGPPLPESVSAEGFGTRLTRVTVESHLQGRIEREWKREGLVLRLRVPLSRLCD